MFKALESSKCIMLTRFLALGFIFLNTNILCAANVGIEFDKNNPYSIDRDIDHFGMEQVAKALSANPTSWADFTQLVGMSGAWVPNGFKLFPYTNGKARKELGLALQSALSVTPASVVRSAVELHQGLNMVCGASYADAPGIANSSNENRFNSISAFISLLKSSDYIDASYKDNLNLCFKVLVASTGKSDLSRHTLGFDTVLSHAVKDGNPVVVAEMISRYGGERAAGAFLDDTQAWDRFTKTVSLGGDEAIVDGVALYPFLQKNAQNQLRLSLEDATASIPPVVLQVVSSGSKMFQVICGPSAATDSAAARNSVLTRLQSVAFIQSSLPHDSPMYSRFQKCRDLLATVNGN